MNYTEINRESIINAYVDGMELGQVNIWESYKNKDKIVSKCLKNEKVTVMFPWDLL